MITTTWKPTHVTITYPMGSRSPWKSDCLPARLDALARQFVSMAANTTDRTAAAELRERARRISQASADLQPWRLILLANVAVIRLGERPSAPSPACHVDHDEQLTDHTSPNRYKGD